MQSKSIIISPQEPKPLEGLLAQANAVQLQALRDLILTYMKELQPDHKPSLFDLHKTRHNHKVKMASFLLQVMTTVGGRSYAITNFLKKCQTLKDKEPELLQHLQAHRRPLENQEDVRDFAQIYLHMHRRNQVIDAKAERNRFGVMLGKHIEQVHALLKQLKLVGHVAPSSRVLTKFGKAVIVPLRLFELHPAYKDYHHMTFMQQVDWVVARIRRACEELAKYKPYHMWMMGLNEYALGHNGSRYVPVRFVSYWDRAILKLLDEYPNLYLIDGTIATYETCPGNDLGVPGLLAETQADYELQVASQEEKSGVYKQLSQHKDSTDRVAAWQDVLTADDSITIVRNTSGIFQPQGASFDASVKKGEHGKVHPFQETKDIEQVLGPESGQHVFYKVGGGKNKSSIFLLTHPFTGAKFKLGLEICLEHRRGKLQQDAQSSADILLQVVVSNSVNLHLTHMCAKYLVQIDSFHKPILLSAVDEPDGQEALFEYYEVDMLANLKDCTLLGVGEGPVYPLKPFELRVVAVIMDAFRGNANDALLEQLISDFHEFIEWQIRTPEYQRSEPIYQWLESRMDTLPQLSLRFVLQEMIEDERTRHPRCRDIYPEIDRAFCPIAVSKR